MKTDYFRKYKSFLSPTLGLIAAIILIYFAGWKQVYENIIGANYTLFIMAALVANLPLIVYGIVWKKTLNIVGIDLDYLTNYQVLLSNTFVNNLTPFGNIGGEAAATYFLGKITRKSSGKIFSAVFTASLINFTPIISLSLIGLLLLGYWNIILVLLISLCLIIWYIESILIKLRRLRALNNRISEFIYNFKHSMKLFADKKLTLSLLLLVTHISVIFNVLSVALLGQAYGSNILVTQLLIILPLARVANYAPTPGGSGSYELVLTGLLMYFTGIDVDAAVSIALGYRIITYYLGLLVGYVAFTSLYFTEKMKISVENK